MRLVRVGAVSLLVLLCSISAGAVEYRQIMELFERVDSAIESGTIVPERDLAPVIEMLRRTANDPENQERVVERISDLGEADGRSPAAVKRYLLDQATPLLLEISENPKNKWSLRGSAMFALRDMGAPRPVLERLIAMAAKDPDEFVQSRGEILQGFVRSMPEENEMDSVRPTDPEKERKAIALLQSHNAGISLDQLRMSAVEVHPDEIRALLDAGVDPNGGAAGDRPLVRLLSACSSHGESEELLQALDLLVTAGADLGALDENSNPPVMSAAQYCGAKVVDRLVAAGAKINVANGSGITPLMMACFTGHLDAAEALADKGARLTPEQASMISASATDPRVKGIVTKATAKKKSK